MVDKFPEGLMAPKQRTLKDLKAGERSAFPLRENLECGEIWLDTGGKYHLSIPNNTKPASA